MTQLNQSSTEKRDETERFWIKKMGLNVDRVWVVHGNFLLHYSKIMSTINFCYDT